MKLKNFIKTDGGSLFFLQLLRCKMKNMKEIQLTELIGKYLSGKANKQEREIIERWYESFDTSEAKFEKKFNIKNSSARSWEAVKNRINKKRNVEFGKVYLWIAAASIIILLFSSLFLLVRSSSENNGKPTKEISELQDALPGGDRAMLILSDGRQIVLDTVSSGILVEEDNYQITKEKDGLLVCRELAGYEENNEKIRYSIISTPKGGKYRILLTDGSKVFLNTASSMKFPLHYARKERKVEIEGEAFFEVARNKHKPFIVKKGDVEVKVLGTKFNMQAYDDDQNIEVTLVEGLVSIEKSDTRKGSQLLRPGEKIQIGKNGRRVLIKETNVDEATAWKDNLFWFDDSDINQVSKILSRWYNIRIEVRGHITDKFTGSIPMDLPLSKVLGMLQKTTNLRYKFIGNEKIILTL
ncbi:MAG: FecR domain-containing protein [Chitinophagaceae bacterium]|nr:FecR domain-containing protein [Chitinophagaceae bacterium]